MTGLVTTWPWRVASKSFRRTNFARKSRKFGSARKTATAGRYQLFLPELVPGAGQFGSRRGSLAWRGFGGRALGSRARFEDARLFGEQGGIAVARVRPPQPFVDDVEGSVLS